MARLKDAETAVLSCALEDKALLIEAAPEIYFETDHYRGWALVLARMGAISDAELRHRVEIAWRMGATGRELRRHLPLGFSLSLPCRRRMRGSFQEFL